MIKQNTSLLGMAAALTLTFSTAHAGAPFGGLWDRSSLVEDDVSESGGVFTYNYTVINTSTRCAEFGPGCDFHEGGDPLIIDWELPYFTDSSINLASIQSPDGWDWAIETIGTANFATGWDGVANWQDPADPWYAGPDSPFTTVTQVLHWYVTDPLACDPFVGVDSFTGSASVAAVTCDGILPIDSVNFIDAHQDRLSGFSFEAAFDSTAAPYQASWFEYPVETGDPAFPLGGGIPNSPSLNRDDGTQVPVPAPLLLIAAALFGLARRMRH